MSDQGISGDHKKAGGNFSLGWWWLDKGKWPWNSPPKCPKQDFSVEQCEKAEFDGRFWCKHPMIFWAFKKAQDAQWQMKGLYRLGFLLSAGLGSQLSVGIWRLQLPIYFRPCIPNVQLIKAHLVGFCMYPLFARLTQGSFMTFVGDDPRGSFEAFINWRFCGLQNLQTWH